MFEKRDIELFIVDVFVSIQKVKEYIEPFENSNDFVHSSLHWDASMRKLEIIGEALNKLLEDKNFNSLSPSYFRKIVNFRNVIAHGYFGIDVDEVWDIVTNKLQILEDDLFNIVKNNIDISLAVSYEIQNYKNLDDIVIVNYLSSLSNL